MIQVSAGPHPSLSQAVSYSPLPALQKHPVCCSRSIPRGSFHSLPLLQLPECCSPARPWQSDRSTELLDQQEERRAFEPAAGGGRRFHAALCCGCGKEEEKAAGDAERARKPPPLLPGAIG
eukprot:175518-Hanusia_phi.AAC.1